MPYYDLRNPHAPASLALEPSLSYLAAHAISPAPLPFSYCETSSLEIASLPDRIRRARKSSCQTVRQHQGRLNERAARAGPGRANGRWIRTDARGTVRRRRRASWETSIGERQQRWSPPQPLWQSFGKAVIPPDEPDSRNQLREGRRCRGGRCGGRPVNTAAEGSGIGDRDPATEADPQEKGFIAQDSPARHTIRIQGEETDTDNTSRRSPVSPASHDDDEATPRGSFDADDDISGSGWSRLSTRRNTINNLLSASTTPSRLQPNVASSILGDETTTDDEDIVPFPRLANSTIRGSSTSSGTGAAAGGHIPTPSSSSDSYFPLRSESMSRQHRAGHRPKSPLATHSSDLKSGQDIWDYSETEWWGWIILIVTWIVFVIGMGSCFGVWSWAWDVGETPYAPPELEDDPTLPIVGYYPALIVCTAVMAWVWVVIAWVGMKYFKHANISGEDI
ncbi:hypothetical protein AN1091.2 [Paecilomyces variotii No. 5]|uniref:Uncharacterized protein n=1 Tax=Byssochlamys spectabilis (strain No. 5 / NBRC 109023) TaxID=1356009 RepID=V5FSS4_BYSSN|nr:hypothetical protein AN1091.2 [Paecilomyces variotii No. 5]